MKKVTKATIKKELRINGKVKFNMIPCKVGLNSAWIQPVEKEVTSIDELEKAINEFEYYNCNNEVGRYPHYYI